MKYFWHKCLAALLLGLTVSSLCGAQDLFNRLDPIAFTFLQKLQPSQKMRDYPILNVGGELGLVHLKTTYSTGMLSGIPIGTAYLVDIRNAKYFASIEMQGNLEQGNSSDWTDEPCKREDYLWKRSTGGKFRNINCVTINHLTRYFASPTGEFQQYLVRFREIGVEFPPTVIRIEFTRYTDNGRRLVYRVSVNPEVFGIDRDAEPLWGTNSWHKSFINKDQKKVAFIASLSKWAEDIQNQMEDAFDKKPDAFASIPAFVSYFK